jgi:hypothetical protein
MGKVASNRRDELSAVTEPTWADAHALLDIQTTDADRLDIWAGDGEEGPEAPASVCSDPSLLLAWCDRYAPEMVLDDQEATLRARNRTMEDLIRQVRRREPKLRVTAAHVIEYLKEATP